ncbi:hypothetical protein ACQR16_26085 [Bradyrhizobium oligotrophicum]
MAKYLDWGKFIWLLASSGAVPISAAEAQPRQENFFGTVSITFH